MSNKYFAEEKTLKNGFVAKRIGYKWGLYDKDGKVLMRPLYDFISINQEGRIWARFLGKKFYVEDDKLPYSFDFIHDSETDKVWYVIESNGYFGVVNKHLKTIIPMKFKYIIDYGGILWVTNDYRLRDPFKRNSGNTGFFDCMLFSYEGNLITENRYNLIGVKESNLSVSPSFPIVNNNEGFNIINNDKKEVLSMPAKSITKINDWYIIEYEKEQFLYDSKNNRFLNKYRYSIVNQWGKSSNIFICRRLSDLMCDVYNDGEIVGSFNFVQYNLVDVVDKYIIVKSAYSFKYGFIDLKGMVVPCIYDQITCFRGAVNIIIAELFEETSKEQKGGAVYVQHNSGRLPGFYVIKGRYDIFGFDGHCICENNDILSSNLFWKKECDHFYIKSKFIEQITPGRIGTKAAMIKQYDFSGKTKQIEFIKDASWNNFNNNLEIIMEDGSTVSISSSKSMPVTKEITESVKIIEKIVYSESNIRAMELLNSNYKPKDDLSPVEKEGKWGYIDESGETIIPFEYDEAQMFSDGLAAVRKGDLFGYIDGNNNVIIDFKFVQVWPFVEGLAKFDNNPYEEYNNHFHDYNLTDNGYISKDGALIDCIYKKHKQHYYIDRYQNKRDTWDAMTDGMYGDYPGPGFDYDTIGFGI